MEPLSPRQAQILTVARERGRVQVDSLSEAYEVSVQTIRKDLNELCDRKLLQRIHGGALYPSGASNYAYDSRMVLAEDEKRRIGVRTASLIPDNCAVILNIGTTTEQVAQALRTHQGLMVVTNNLNVANLLRGAENIEVIVAGGIVRSTDGGIVGESAVEFIRQFRVDYAVIGASAIDPDGLILDYDYREVRVSQEIMRQARQTILVADSMKFDRRAPVRIGHLSEIDVFVTDAPLPDSLAAICREHDVAVEICGAPDSVSD
ncbi:MAG: DeoR/GlpR family DNA-binding transcription regulator [Alphaproteobacteria bacterium]|uniref:DeoR/GlpR family DNA-binding transcription regulator n=1 Tax=Pacificispira sp. TaxID=2888761 RepID=UPI002EBEC8B0|nr:DeoR/GlpR family DNA-binding transcription regulator [Pseudomonadota bacterium]